LSKVKLSFSPQLAWRMMIWGALSCLLAACATLPQGPWVGPLPTSGQIMERLEARRLAVRSFVMQGTIQVKTPEDELYGDHVIKGVFPDHLRADVLGPFGRPVLTFLSSGNRLIVLDYRENQAFVGPASRQNVARFLGLALSPAEIYTILSGSVPLLPHDKAQVAPAPEPGQAQLKLLGADGSISQAVVFSLHDFAVRRAWLEEWSGQDRTGPNLECLFDSFVPLGLGDYPRNIELKDDQQRRVALASDQLTLNQPVDGSLFEMAIPPGIQVRELK